MTAATLAMGRAVSSLNAIKTAEAMPAELEALDHLLKALGDVKKRQVTRQAGVGAGGSNRSAPDLSSLFDKELQRQQQTNYETPSGAEQRDEADTSLLEKIRDLAARQDELMQRQQNLARDRQRMTAEELKRALETLTREQSQLRERAEDVSQQLSERQDAQSSSSSKGQQRDSSQRGQQGQPAQAGQARSSGSTGASGSPQQAPSSESSQTSGEREAKGRDGQRGDRLRRERLKDASEDMRRAVSELRRDDPSQATARSARALETLRDLERQLGGDLPGERRRAVGDLQLEARQLADAQRQVSAELGRTGQGDASRDARRRLAGEQDRLAERAERLRQTLDRTAAGAGTGTGQTRRKADDPSSIQRALTDASREIARERVAERMRQAAEALRASSAASPGEAGAPKGPGKPRGTGGGTDEPRASQERDHATRQAQDQVARALDRLADRLGASSGSQDDESQRLASDLARARELREQMEATSGQLEKLGHTTGSKPGSSPGQRSGRQAPDGSGPSSTTGAAVEGEVARLGEEYQRQLRETRQLLERLGTDERKQGRGGSGATFEQQGMVLSAPGTEAFKQDFAKWEELRKQASQALERAESTLAQRLQRREAHERLGLNVDDRPPPEYAAQVDQYFKSLATKKAK